MLKYPEGRAGDYTIPSTVSVIGKFALKNFSLDNILTIPNSVEMVEYGGLIRTEPSDPEKEKGYILVLPDSLSFAEGAVCAGRHHNVYFSGKFYLGDDYQLHRNINCLPFDRQ